jgi:hypothetical protein
MAAGTLAEVWCCVHCRLPEMSFAALHSLADIEHPVLIQIRGLCRMVSGLVVTSWTMPGFHERSDCSMKHS